MPRRLSLQQRGRPGDTLLLKSHACSPVWREHPVSQLPSDGERCHDCIAARIYPEENVDDIEPLPSSSNLLSLHGELCREIQDAVVAGTGRRFLPPESSIPGLPGGTRLDEFRLRWYSSGCIHLASKEEEEAPAQARFYRPSVDGVLRRGCKERDPARRPAIP
jgi:hypothetical protein